MTIISLQLDASKEECDGISHLEWGVFPYKTVAVLDRCCGSYLLDHFDMQYPDECGGKSVKEVSIDSVVECLKKTEGASFAFEISKRLIDEEFVYLAWSED